MEAEIETERGKFLRNMPMYLPEPKELLDKIGSAEVTYGGKRASIKGHVEEQLNEIKKRRESTNNEKFRKFLFGFLYVQVKDEIVKRTIEALEQKFGSSNPDTFVGINPTELEKVMREKGYRFPGKSKMLIEIAKVLKEKFKGNMEDYITYVENYYEKDPILKVNGVSYKTRDWALSQLSSKYCLVDVHIRNVLRNTGLSLYSYLYGIPLSTDRIESEEYKNIRDLLVRLTEEIQFEPFAMVQYLWFFGRGLCSDKKCAECPIKKCMSRMNISVREGLK